MTTPICDFVRQYAKTKPIRLHMPGHKGRGPLGAERWDITEIDGADDLFAPAGVIKQSEQNAGALFGAKTLYSTAGSTLCIQAMVYLAALAASAAGAKPLILAARNAHKAFLHAAALLGVQVQWLYPEGGTAYYSGVVTPQAVQAALNAKNRPTAVYITSPDYTGNLADIAGIAAVCHKAGALLLVDNAHGAYLNFLPESPHPIALGADLCCDSAHKTLPVLTGGAYLHLNNNAPELLKLNARTALGLFGSSSPSYLILQSLDAANEYLTTFSARLAAFLPKVQALKTALQRFGYRLVGQEPLKLTLLAGSVGYSGQQLAGVLKQNGIYPEFYDKDLLVLMLTPQNRAGELKKLQRVLCSVTKMKAVKTNFPKLSPLPAALTPRQTLFCESEILPLEQCLGRVCAAAALSCPPAVPIAVCGEVLTKEALSCLAYYGIKQCAVVKAGGK